MKRKDIEERLILVALTGSHSYGLNMPSSDKDYKGIFIASSEYYIGLKSIEQKDNGWESEEGNGKFDYLGEKDTVAYELRKYLRLAAKCNPNILELLFEDPKFYTYINDKGQVLIDNKELFLSKRVRHTYAGYAHQQIKKVKTHRKWLLNAPTNAPNPVEFGLEEYEKPLSKGELNAFLEFAWMLIRDRIEYLDEEQELYTLLTERIDIKHCIHTNIPSDVADYLQLLTRSTDDFMALLTCTQQYRKALNEWNSYKQWKKNRNKDRAQLESKCGYDSKHMAHCIRLLRTGNEILLGQGVLVNREHLDAAELLEIRKGNVPYEVVEQQADFLFRELENSYKLSKLPYSVDENSISNLCMELITL